MFNDEHLVWEGNETMLTHAMRQAMKTSMGVGLVSGISRARAIERLDSYLARGSRSLIAGNTTFRLGSNTHPRSLIPVPFTTLASPSATSFCS